MDEKTSNFLMFKASEGKRASQILISLGKKRDFVEALNTRLGQELLRDLLRMYEVKLEKVIEGKATERDKEALVIFRCLASKWADKINEYNKEVGLLKMENK